jgi:hypothetical protein
VLPAPKLSDAYDVKWTLVKVLDDEQRAQVAGAVGEPEQGRRRDGRAAERDPQRVLGLVPLELVQGDYVPPAASRCQSAPVRRHRLPRRKGRLSGCMSYARPIDFQGRARRIVNGSFAAGKRSINRASCGRR